ncbi:apoptosis regulator BAX [Pelodytes ibericus]
MADKGAGGDSPREKEGAAAAPGASRGAEAGGGGGDTTEQILQTGGVLLRGFIAERVQRVSEGASPNIPELGSTEDLHMNAATKDLCDCLRRIGDELDNNMELQRMIEKVQSNPPKEVFFKVAMEMFADGNFNWGRVVALFYFACKLVLKALRTQIPLIINWTMEYLRDHVVQWIQNQGGWEGLISYVSTPTWQTISVFLAGAITAALTIWKMS